MNKVIGNEIKDKDVEKELTFIYITMPDNSVWQVKAEVIATLVATAIADRDWGKVRTEQWQKAFNYAYNHLMHNSYELWLYAGHYMSWQDLEATMIAPPIIPNYALWFNATTKSKWRCE